MIFNQALAVGYVIFTQYSTLKSIDDEEEKYAPTKTMTSSQPAKGRKLDSPQLSEFI